MEPTGRARVPRGLILVTAVLALALAAGAWLGLRELDLSTLRQTARDGLEYAGHLHPAVFMLAVAILPYAAVPVSPIYLAAGAVLNWETALFWCGLGLGLNIALGHAIGARLLRGPLLRWLERRGHRVPVVPPGEHAALVALTRLIPGPPLVIQNLLLAIAGVPFGKYLAVSWPLQFLFTLAFVLTGHGAVGGGAKYALTGLGALVALALLARFLKKIHDARRAPAPAHAAQPPHPGA